MRGRIPLVSLAATDALSKLVWETSKRTLMRVTISHTKRPARNNKPKVIAGSREKKYENMDISSSILLTRYCDLFLRVKFLRRF